MTKKSFLINIFFVIFWPLILSCSLRTPVISSIDPKIGRIGEVITLSGNNFGDERDNSSYVTIAGISPTNSSYQLWQDDLISVRVPELGESGLVYVHVRGKRSNGVLFSNSASVPRPVEGEVLGLEPRIISVTPQTGVSGSPITITGSNFGVSRENSQAMSGVFFSWDFESGPFNPFVVSEPEFIEVSEIELGYENWSSREIRVRLPDGAVSGNFEVRTPHGRSRPVFFDVSDRPGYKYYKDKIIYTITYSVDIRVLEATRPNILYLWVPMPVNTPSQRNVSLVSRTGEPYIENHRGVSLFKLDNLAANTTQSINLSFRLETYSVETSVRHTLIRQETSPLSVMYTQSTALMPSSNQQIRAAAGSITGREQNPYLKARLIYDWIIANIQMEETRSSSHAAFAAPDLAAALEQRRADTCTAALLFTVMARAAGVPCIPVAGVLIDQNGNTVQHYWAEFWIDAFGWVPVDPAMGAGAPFAAAGGGREQAGFYFGNIDNQRIAFSRGDILLSQMESRGRVVSRPRSYSLQNIWEEAGGGLESYSSLWGDIIISGKYSQ